MDKTSAKGFAINDAKIPILLVLRRTEDLRPHEETVQQDLEGIVRGLKRDPVLRHPIIADSVSGAVLDGTHRLAALQELDCRTVPTALIDYQNPLVQVDRWFRRMSGESIQEFVKRVRRLSPYAESTIEADKSLLARSSYASLHDNQQCFSFKAETSIPIELCRQAYSLEQTARSNHMKIAYTDTEETKDQSQSTILMSTIRLNKDEIIDSCRARQLYPPKSTRHIIPSRPLGISIPLMWLRETDISRAEEEFEQKLSRMTVRRLPQGSVVGSRRYMEEVFLFE